MFLKRTFGVWNIWFLFLIFFWAYGHILQSFIELIVDLHLSLNILSPFIMPESSDKLIGIYSSGQSKTEQESILAQAQQHIAIQVNQTSGAVLYLYFVRYSH